MGQAALMDEKLPEITEGFLLGGRVSYAQPRTGYRTGIEPVLLAAGVPAKRGERVLEAGCGAGAGLLCLAARVPGIVGVGIERDPAMAALAHYNFRQSDTLTVETMDLLDLPPAPTFDHVFANPPWHRENSTASPDPGRDRAKRAPADLLEAWIETLLPALRPGGSITLILPAEQFARACGCLEAARAGKITLLPLWPREGIPARLALVAARKGRGGPARVLPGLTLHQGDEFSAAAERILREGAELAM